MWPMGLAFETTVFSAQLEYSILQGNLLSLSPISLKLCSGQLCLSRNLGTLHAGAAEPKREVAGWSAVPGRSVAR